MAMTWATLGLVCAAAMPAMPRLGAASAQAVNVRRMVLRGLLMVLSAGWMRGGGGGSLDGQDALLVPLAQAMVGRPGGLKHGLAEGPLVNRDQVVPLVSELLHQARLGGEDLVAGLVCGFLHHRAEDLLVLVREPGPQ